MKPRKSARKYLICLLLALVLFSTSFDNAARTTYGNTEPERDYLILTAVGDIVMHLPIVSSSYNPSRSEYDFRPIFTGIEPELSAADLTVGVLETQLSGAESKYTGYPRFNSPYTIADALQWAGFDLVFTAHNHALDQGTAGLMKTLSYLEKLKLPYTGCRMRQDQPRFRLIERRGIRLAFCSYTTGTNGIPLPTGKEWQVNIFDFNKLNADILAAKQAGADGIILALHSGVEYQRLPSPEQQQFCQGLLAAGVDVILGSHVHVVQPLASQLIVDPGSNENRHAFIAYSLGNFLSNQYWRYSDSGLMLNLKIFKRSHGAGINVIEANHFPLWVDRFDRAGRSRYQIYKITENELPEEIPDLSAADRQRMAEVWQETEELLRSWNKR